MVDHKEREEFFKKLLEILFQLVHKHADIVMHVVSIRALINDHKDKNKFAKALAEFNDNEIEMLVRFVERPRGRHHIHEVKDLWEKYGAEQAGRQLLEHFYKHNNSQLIHGRKLRLSFH
jgi:hypothetical protein